MASSLLLRVVAFSAACLCVAAGDGAFLVVSKSAKTKRLGEKAEEITVAFAIYNRGSSIAYDVALADATWPADSFDVVGNTTKAWDKLEGGASVSHSFVVKPKAEGLFSPAPAVVTFRVPSKTELQTAFSTPLAELSLLKPISQEARYAWIKEFAQQFGPLISALSIVALAGYVVFAPISSRKSSKKRR